MNIRNGFGTLLASAIGVRRGFVACALTASFIVASLPAEGATITPVPVSNSSFELVPSSNGSASGWGDFPDPALYSPASTWVASNGYAVGGYATSPVGDHFTYTPDASSRFLYLSDVGTITQDLNTTVKQGDIVTLNFFDGNDRANVDGYASHIGGGELTATIKIGTQTISQNFDTTNATPDVWIAETLSGAASSTGNLSISFATVTGTPWMDDVSVTITSVPEPSPLVALFGVCGMGLIVLAVRRRRSA
jgi:hypothetical protein